MNIFSFLMKAVVVMSFSNESSFAFAINKPVASELKATLQRPLIVGASVSGDYFTASPGKRLALKHTTVDQIKVIAFKGKAGREVLKSVTDTTLKDRTSIIGIDLFFWDSFNGSLAESLKSLERLIQLATKNSLPLVVGEIPEFSPQFQPHARALNKKIHESCQAANKCRVLPLNELLRKVLTDGYLVQNNTKYALEKLLPDGLHIATPASEYLADRISELL